MRFGTHMLAEEADDWWIGLLPILEQDGAEVTWAVFKREFLESKHLQATKNKRDDQEATLEREARKTPHPTPQATQGKTVTTKSY